MCFRTDRECCWKGQLSVVCRKFTRCVVLVTLIGCVRVIFMTVRVWVVFLRYRVRLRVVCVMIALIRGDRAVGVLV